MGQGAGWEMVPSRYRGYAVGPWRLLDLRAIRRLEQTVFLEPISWQKLWAAWRNPKAVYLVVRDGQNLAAYFGFEVVGGFAHVLANVTHPGYRRQGLAQFVLTAAAPVALRLGAGAFVGEVRVSNHAQLEVLARIGWQVVGRAERHFANGEDAWLVLGPITPKAASPPGRDERGSETAEAHREDR
jgi:ribosomal protein S18 acetylase RimI-like enzyme